MPNTYDITSENAPLIQNGIGRVIELSIIPDPDRARVDFDKEWDKTRRPMHMSPRSEEDKDAAWETAMKDLTGSLVIGTLVSYRETNGEYMFKFEGDSSKVTFSTIHFTWKVHFEV